MNYILQKDTPDNSQGNKFLPMPNGEEYYYENDARKKYWRTDVENNPEWFKPEEERVKAVAMAYDYSGDKTSMYAISNVENRPTGEVQNLIEAALNGELFTKEDLLQWLFSPYCKEFRTGGDREATLNEWIKSRND